MVQTCMLPEDLDPGRQSLYFRHVGGNIPGDTPLTALGSGCLEQQWQGQGLSQGPRSHQQTQTHHCHMPGTSRLCFWGIFTGRVDSHMTARHKLALGGQEEAQAARPLQEAAVGPGQAPGPVLPPQPGSPLSLPHLLFLFWGISRRCKRLFQRRQIS